MAETNRRRTVGWAAVATASVTSAWTFAVACTPSAVVEATPVAVATPTAVASVMPSAAPPVAPAVAAPVAADPGVVAAAPPVASATTLTPPSASAEPAPKWPPLSDPVAALRRAAQRRVLSARVGAGKRAAAAEVAPMDAAPRAPAPAPVPAAAAPARFGAARAGAEAALADLPIRRRVPIEDDASLAHFRDALSRLERGEGPPKVRILAYGASHTEGDIYTGYLRAYLQGRFGDGGRGFVLLGRVNAWHRTLDTQARQEGLSVHTARSRLHVVDEPLGLFGAALVGAQAHAHAEVSFVQSSPNTQFELAYYTDPEGGSFDLLVDGRRLSRIDTRSTAPGPAYYAFEAPAGAHVFRAELAGNGSVRLFGIVAETAKPGIVVDTLGIGGAQMADSLSWDADGWIEAVRHRQPDLVTFAYGTNEVFNTGLGAESYAHELEKVLTRFRRALPDASCVLITPFDLPEPNRARLGAILEVQRRVAPDFGCGVWDGDAFMGGDGSIRRWAAAEPPLASPDHIHLTRLGYVVAGTALGDALLRTFDLGPG